jgi:hypothetical protein
MTDKRAWMKLSRLFLSPGEPLPAFSQTGSALEDRRMALCLDEMERPLSLSFEKLMREASV